MRGAEKHRRRTLRAAVVAALLPALIAAVAVAQPAAPAGNALRGRSLFLQYGCQSCHGTTGIGTSIGPPLAPNPMPWRAFITHQHQRRGAERWPEPWLSDAQFADIYAYLASIRREPPAARSPPNEP